jgi:hypothetical protein
LRIVLSIRDEDLAYYDKEAKNRGQTRTGFIKQVLYEWREARERDQPICERERTDRHEKV